MTLLEILKYKHMAGSHFLTDCRALLWLVPGPSEACWSASLTLFPLSSWPFSHLQPDAVKHATQLGSRKFSSRDGISFRSFSLNLLKTRRLMITSCQLSSERLSTNSKRLDLSFRTVWWSNCRLPDKENAEKLRDVPKLLWDWREKNKGHCSFQAITSFGVCTRLQLFQFCIGIKSSSSCRKQFKKILLMDREIKVLVSLGIFRFPPFCIPFFFLMIYYNTVLEFCIAVIYY